MTSDRDDEVYVWVLLPGDVLPTLCGRLRISEGHGGTVAEFVYGRSYLESKNSIALDPIRLPLGTRPYKATSQHAGGDPDEMLGGPCAGTRLLTVTHDPTPRRRQAA